MKKYGVLILTIFLVGCLRNDDGSFGRPESPIWHSETALEIKLEYFRKKCEYFGYERETSAMRDCLKDTITQSEASARAAMASIPTYQPTPGITYQPMFSGRNSNYQSPFFKSYK